MTKFSDDKFAGKCDKCGGPVYKGNSALHLSVLAGETRAPGLIVFTTRHLLEVEGCEGSPSRRERIKDTREFTDAYEALLAEFPLDDRFEVEGVELTKEVAS